MQRLFKATIIVTFFSVATRALGFVLRIILSRYLGAEMLGHYQVAMSVFGVLMTLVASGLPLIVSRNVAYNKSIKNNKTAYSFVSAGLIITLSISILVSLIIVIFPSSLDLILNQSASTSIILYTLPGLIASAIYCVLRSALWGDKHFFAISFTEFFEQVVRIILCFILFASPILPALSYGEKATLSLSLACILSSILVIVIYFALKQKLSNPKPAFKPLLKGSSPITALRTVSSLVQSLIAIIIPIRLTTFGYTFSEAMSEYGVLMGMAFPLILIPGTLISSVAVTLIPEISSKTDNIDDASRVHDIDGLKKNITLGIDVSVIISILFVPALMVLGTPICEILFNSSSAGRYVSLASIIIPAMGINQITSSILNSIGLEIKSLINYVFGAIALFICIYFLPRFMGTYALILGLGLMNVITAVLNLRMLKKRNLVSSKNSKFMFCCILFVILSSVVGLFVNNIIKLFLPMFFATMITGIICVFFMLGLIYVFNIANIKGFIVLKRQKLHKNI